MKLIIQTPDGSTCSCGTWLDHWNKFSGQAASTLCPVMMCVEKTEVGAHVQREGQPAKGTFILPLCKNHSEKAGEVITVNDYLPLVSTNVNETCAKPQTQSAST